MGLFYRDGLGKSTLPGATSVVSEAGADPAEAEVAVSALKHARKARVAAPYGSLARKDPRLKCSPLDLA